MPDSQMIGYIMKEKKYSKTIIRIIILACTLIGAACTHTIKTVPVVTPLPSEAGTSPNPISTFSIPKTDTPIPTITLTPQAPLTPSPDESNKPIINNVCMDFKGDSVPIIKGRLVISGYQIAELTPSPDDRSYLLDMNSGEKIYLGHTQFETVSPNGEWLAYYEIDKEQVVISNYEGEQVYQIPSPKKELWPAYWLDDRRLLLNKQLNENHGYIYTSLLVLNPFTKETQEFLPEYPDQNYEIFYNWQITSNLVPNTELTQMIYPKYVDGFPITLVDISTNRIIRNIYGGDGINIPRWSTDGNSFLTSAPMLVDYNQKIYVNIDDGLPNKDGNELILGRTNGDLRRLTYYTLSEQSTVERYQWSRDGQMIAFLQLDTLHSAFPELNVLKINKSEITNYCATTHLPEASAMYIWPPEPVWSPENLFLAVTFLDSDYRFTVNLVELSNGNTWQIAKNGSARGWMIEPYEK
jgi:hypothetical protein